MEEEKKEAEVKSIMKSLLKVILGIVLVALGIWGIYVWRSDVLTIIKGSIGVIFILAGLICLAIAKE